MLSAVACSPGGPAAGRPPDIILVVLDTVRRDRLSLYGYERETSPNLDALARSSRTFTRAYSTSSWTAPAHASLFTGLYPAAHGVTQEAWRLEVGLTTLAEILGEHGYETLAVVGNAMLSSEWGFAQGFEQYLDAWQISRERFPRSKMLATTKVDDVAADLVAELVASRASDRPLFLFVNLIGPHSPYNSCGEHCGRFVTDPAIKRQGYWLAEHYKLPTPFTPEEIRHLSELYDAEILKVDEVLGRIAETLRGAGLLDDALLVVTSDHGEAFGDGGHMGHMFNVREATTAVPLLLSRPSLFEPGSRDDMPTQLTDIFTTALRLAGADPTEYAPHGVDLAESAAPEERPVLLEYYTPNQALRLRLANASDEERARLARFDRHLQAVIAGRRKLVRGSDGSRELYDLAADPQERVDLAGRTELEAERRELEARLDALLGRYSTGPHREAEPPVVPDRTRGALEALGYVE